MSKSLTDLAELDARGLNFDSLVFWIVAALLHWSLICLAALDQ